MPSPSTNLASGPAPSRTRWKILALLTLISIITYVDRVNISVAARQMMPALGLTQMQMGYVFSAFVLGYALFQVPGGWLGDRWGTRLVLAGAVVWWSLFTALTAVAGTLPTAEWLGVLGSLILIRFLIGVGEAAALPNFNRAVANWFPLRERGLGMGVSIGGIGIGSAITPPLVAWMMVNFGWQSTFYAAGLAGMLITGLWGWYATDRPEQHRGVNHEELAYIRGETVTPTHPSPLEGEGEGGGASPVPWSAFLRTPSVWWIVISYTALGYVAYVYMSWFYLYLVNERGFGVLRGAFFASGPFLAMTVLCPLGGWVTDRVAAALGMNAGRSWVGSAGMLLSGIMNTGANVGGTLSPTLTPWMAEHFGWNVSLGFAAAIAAIGGLLWLLIRPGDGLKRGR